MTDIILSGCFGKMGCAITQIVAQREDCRIVAGIDISDGTADYPVYKYPQSVKEKGDVIIDFSHPSTLSGLLEFAVKTGTAAVIATTGLNESQKNLITLTSDSVPVFFTANMSLGVSLLCELSKTAAKILGNSFDIEIVEMHHNRKIDAPSGTALMLADAVSACLPQQPEYEYNRHDRSEQRPKNEIGIHSVRGGTIVGEHEVIFAGEDEVIKLCHSAGSKRVFAAGAVNAAVYISGKHPGLYTMDDLVSES